MALIMDVKTLQLRLRSIEAHTQTPVFSLSQARIIFPEGSDQNLMNSLQRHSKAGFLRKVCTGVWLNSLSAYQAKGNVLHQVATLLRPSDFNYVSLESVLSESSVISQQLQGYLTVMTTGRRRVYKTSLGTIEFTHTKRDPRSLLRDTTQPADSSLRRATIARAFTDLKRVGRNVEMVDNLELRRSISQEEADVA